MKLVELPLLKPHVGKPAILDANLLLLDWCMEFDQSLLQSFKRLNNFEPNDAQLLSETLKLFPSLWTTPHVLTEVSNLANSLPSWIKGAWFAFFAKRINLVPEIYTQASEIASDAAAIRFGLTDAALTRLAATHVILTVDWPLANGLESRGLSVINFNHLRRVFLFS
jgi:hypothetical protein